MFEFDVRFKFESKNRLVMKTNGCGGPSVATTIVTRDRKVCDTSVVTRKKEV